MAKEPRITTGLMLLLSAMEISNLNKQANTQWKEINQGGRTEILPPVIFCIFRYCHSKDGKIALKKKKKKVAERIYFL